MYEGIIDTLIRLFAIITHYQDKGMSKNSYTLVGAYLDENFNRELAEKYMELYIEYVRFYHQERKEILYDGDGVTKVVNQKHIREICKNIALEFDLETRFMIIVQLINFINKAGETNPDDLKTVEFVARGFKLNKKEFKNLITFGLHSTGEIKDKSGLMIVNGASDIPDKSIRHLQRENMQVNLEIILISSINTLFFKYHGPRNLYLNGHRLTQRRLYVFPQGGILKTSRIVPIYYSSIMSRFIQERDSPHIVYNAEKIAYKFSKKKYGLHEFSFQERSGDLVGIIGGSGVGKTTLLNVLNGKLKPHKGRITINGQELGKLREGNILKGIVGYVPQDDLLIEELTVYKNLEYNARLCFGNMTDEEIKRIIDQTLIDFDLVEARDLEVGDPLKKILSGGQRKRLNIALELMREPSILFVDEPTSGLSSADSEKVMHLLKKQTLKGKLVFANIHQPGSDLYKLFDRIIVMDMGGRVIFFGNPMDAITYFKNEAGYINPNESECPTCGNVQSEQPLRIIQTRLVDPLGRIVRRRKITPEDWYGRYKEKVEPRALEFIDKNPVNVDQFPKVIFKIPGWFRQMKLFTRRDLETKKANVQYLMIALLQAPVLAIILGFITKFSENGQYLLSHNDNLPAYLFMSVVVALFMGLSMSAEEIFRDRKILMREEFLNLSRGAYLGSKIIIMFIISALQIFIFVLIGDNFLEIKGLFFSNWAILFSAACFANLLGLNLSSGFKSAVTIYIMIPLLLIPQLLLSGVIVDFNKMHHTLKSHNKTPLIGDVMTSRWGYEALAVNQFKNNDYRKNIFDIEMEKSQLGFKTYYWIPEIRKYLNSYKVYVEEGNAEMAQRFKPVVENSFGELFHDVATVPDSVRTAYGKLGASDFNDEVAGVLEDFLGNAKSIFENKYTNAVEKLDRQYSAMEQKFESKDDFIHFRDRHINKKLENILRDKYTLHKTYLYNNHIYQGDEPIYRMPTYNNGRAHFYAPYKVLGNWKIDTLAYNIAVIWALTVLLMAALYFDLLRKGLYYLEKWRLGQQAKLREHIFYNPMDFIKERKEEETQKRK